MASSRGVLLRRGEKMTLRRFSAPSSSANDNSEEEGQRINLSLPKSPASALFDHQRGESLLCSVCVNSLIRPGVLSDIMRIGVVFRRTSKYLESAAQLCCLCSIFHRLIIQPEWEFLTELPNLTFTLTGEKMHKLGGHSILLSIDMHQHGKAAFWVTQAYDDRGKPLSGYTERHKLEVAGDWLKDCIANHEDCGRPQSVPLPTRVLDVAAEDLGSDIRLFLSKGAQSRYAALTYCWGTKQDKMLLKSRLSEYQNIIELCSLPKTVQDAVQTARAVEIRYLWVDAYCIIQDDDEDKAREISNMHRIYENSLVTIAAAGAPDATIGFMNLDPQLETQKFPLMLWNGRVGTFIIQSSLRNRLFDQPINKRAWTLQECLLARRLLWFGSGRSAIEWYCNTVQQDEREALEARVYYRSFDCRLLQKALSFYHRRPDEASAPVHRLCYKWSAIVEQFSGRSLSNPSDKLSALTGIASVFHSMWGGSYYAGLWGQFIFQQLLWSCDPEFTEPETFPRAPPRYRAPSWSWASIDGKLQVPQFPYLETHGLEFVGCNTTLVDEANPFGPVLDGRLRLRGLVKKGFIARYLFDLTCTNPSSSTRTGSVNLDAMKVQTLPEVWCLAVERPLLSEWTDTGSDFSQISSDPPGGWGGLLMFLKEENVGGESIFIRIGTFQLYVKDWFDNCAPQPLTIV